MNEMRLNARELSMRRQNNEPCKVNTGDTSPYMAQVNTEQERKEQ